ncbi:MAG: porphobilinogen synthase [Methanobacteriaceae archaeon]|nr:porphobilinogen synthase [Methanobacteriaceae archaeon]
MVFPEVRMRRLRKTELLRNMFKETDLYLDDFIYPVYLKEDLKYDDKEAIGSMPGQYRFSIDAAVDYLSYLNKMGLKSVLLFGLPSHKDELGSSAYDDNGIVQKVIHRLKDETDLVVIADVCMCEYTDHGHCGILNNNGYVLNDETLKYLSRIAVSYARAGVDIVAPSDMMDGRVGAIRSALDSNGFIDTGIMAYSAKYCSEFYAPFRDAVDSAPGFGDRRSYQMDPCNYNEALREVKLDIDEGADAIIVKPALSYLDVIKGVKDEFKMPTIAYQVSGEYSMLVNAVESGILSESAIWETLISIKRAGADKIISSFVGFMVNRLDGSEFSDFIQSLE